MGPEAMTPRAKWLWIVRTSDAKKPAMWWVDDSEKKANQRMRALNQEDCWLHPRKVRVAGKVAAP